MSPNGDVEIPQIINEPEIFLLIVSHYGDKWDSWGLDGNPFVA